MVSNLYRTKWSPEEDKRMEYLLYDLGLSTMAIGFIMNRTERGVIDRMHRIGLDRKSMSPERIRASHAAWIKIQRDKDTKDARDWLRKDIAAAREEIARNDVKPFKKWF